MISSNNLAQANLRANVSAGEFWNEFQKVQDGLNKLSRFMSKKQFITLACRLKNDNSTTYFYDKVIAMAKRIEAMPANMTGQGLGLHGSSIAYLRYHQGPVVFYVTLKDGLDGVSQAYGWCVSDQRGTEAGPIDIGHLVHHEMTLDLDFEPVTVTAALNQEGEGA